MQTKGGKRIVVKHPAIQFCAFSRRKENELENKINTTCNNEVKYARKSHIIIEIYH